MPTQFETAGRAVRYIQFAFIGTYDRTVPQTYPRVCKWKKTDKTGYYIMTYV